MLLSTFQPKLTDIGQLFSIPINMFIVFGMPVHCSKTCVSGLMASCFVACVHVEICVFGVKFENSYVSLNVIATKFGLIIKLTFRLRSKVSFVFTQTRSNLSGTKTMSV